MDAETRYAFDLQTWKNKMPQIPDYLKKYNMILNKPSYSLYEVEMIIGKVMTLTKQGRLVTTQLGEQAVYDYKLKEIKEKLSLS